MKVYTADTLAECDGKEGRPALVTYGGKVFDVTGSRLWKEGTHMNRHAAGRDLTAFIEAAPHEKDVLNRYPQVGIYRDDGDYAAGRVPVFLSNLLSRFPSLRRHPHPMIVHFPIALIITAVLFDAIFLSSGLVSFKVSALYCLGTGILFSFPAILTGYFTWWLNYGARPMRPVTMKIRLSAVLLITSLIIFFWRLYVPGIETSRTPLGILYWVLLFSCVPLVALTGWYGGRLTFPERGK